MRFAPKRRSSASINLTPLIDMMFLLVIFILVASRFEPDAGIAITLPTARAEGAPPPETTPERVVVAVTRAGEVFMDGARVTAEEFENRLQEARAGMASGGVEPVLVIEGDVAAPHGLVVEVLDAASRMGQRNIRIRTLPADAP